MAQLITEYSKDINKQPGGLENKILNIMSGGNMDYYDALISDEKDIRIWYQLSSLRTGLLSWYPFRHEAKVLEIGAGFGPLTGILCNRCSKVVATEKNIVRAKALKNRWERYYNLTVIAGDLDDIVFKEKYGYIILTGILERIAKGSSNMNDYAAYVNKLKRLLEDDGLILISVENRYGLKYFCGAVEPHTNKAFDGIQGYMSGTGGYSFTRAELCEIAKLTGLNYKRFYYPLPDYKFTQLVYTDEYLPEKNIRERLIPYYTRNDTLVAWEKRLYDDVVEGGAFPFMANSYIMECGMNKPHHVYDVNYAALSTDRGENYALATTICSDEKVRKTPIFESGEEYAESIVDKVLELEKGSIKIIPHKLEGHTVVMPYVKLPTLSNYLKEIVKTDITKFEKIMDMVWENAKKYPEYIELIPLNAFYDEENDDIIYFDQEYKRECSTPEYVMFRAVYYLYCFMPDAEQYYPKKKIMDRYNLSEQWNSLEKQENDFLRSVRKKDKYNQFYKWSLVDFDRIKSNQDRLVSEAEKVAGYEVSDKMKRIWKTELAILDEIEMICKKYNITYYFVHGSLLGAVRHNGFIPWDDDLDIAMKRPDYDKFLDVAAKELNPRYIIQEPGSCNTMYWGGFSRIRDTQTTAIESRDVCREGVQGIWVDILPLDVYSDDEKKLARQNKKLTKISEKFRMGIYNDKKLNFSKLRQKLYKAQTMNNDERSDNLSFFTWGGKHRPLPAKDFADVVMHDFQDRKVPLPCGYEDILFVTLGKDYLKFPPVSERKPKHDGIFDPDVPYTEYQKLLCDTFKNAEEKQIILFGSGMMFEDYMEKYGRKYRPAFIVDNDRNKWEKQRMGIEIKKPEAILEIPERKRHLIICSYYYREISKQLDEMGINDYKIYVQKIEWILRTEKEKDNDDK